MWPMTGPSPHHAASLHSTNCVRRQNRPGNRLQRRRQHLLRAHGRPLARGRLARRQPGQAQQRSAHGQHLK